MTVSDYMEDVRARTHSDETSIHGAVTCGNGPSQASLRVISPEAHIQTGPPSDMDCDSAFDHFADVADDVATHPVAVSLPPTVAEAAGQIWPDRDDVRHGRAGQLAVAAVGVVRVAGLGVCWGVAHVFFGNKIKTGLFLLILIVAIATYLIATNV